MRCVWQRQCVAAAASAAATASLRHQQRRNVPPERSHSHGRSYHQIIGHPHALHCIASHRVISCVVSSFRRRAGPQRTQPQWRQHRQQRQAKGMARQVHGPSTSQQPVSGRPQVHHHQPGVGSGRVGRRSWGRRPPSIHMRCDVRVWNVIESFSYLRTNYVKKWASFVNFTILFLIFLLAKFISSY